MSSVQSNVPKKSRIKAAILALIQMPRMKSSSSQCCLCSIGVFMFVGGIIMIATGASLCLNYNILNDELLLPELRTDEGKKIVGIILICVGLVFAIVSVSVSAYYLCIHGDKAPQNVTPDDIKSISNTSNKSSTRNGNSQRPTSNQSSRSGSSQNSRSTIQGARRKISPADGPKRQPDKPSGSQFSQTMPNIHQRSKHKKGQKKKRLVTKTQLEDIKELDTISRKTLDVDYISSTDNLDDETPRSQSEELDVASLDASETSGHAPHVFQVTTNERHSESAHIDSYNHSDSDDQILASNKQTRRHSHTSHDNASFEEDMTSTGSESTITKNLHNKLPLTGSDSVVKHTIVDEENVQTSVL